MGRLADFVIFLLSFKDLDLVDQWYISFRDEIEYLLYDFIDEIVEPFSFNFSAITRAYRTAICKAKRGGFKDTLPDDLLASVLKVILWIIQELKIILVRIKNALGNIHNGLWLEHGNLEIFWATFVDHWFIDFTSLLFCGS